ncbi:hypothetical protein I6A60_25100 [Frankia sp. AgB1.9]|uniref:Acg family FMN-binding oxidoreductase n=1 Tax=unclassified Frankia TaxID=2632575 RepID=UPI001933B8BA|nr:MULTISPECIES: hypothetical protein [unclassified Frankia]MBL7492298.1 hypothetical protein [Frankia sp. AgW1.1]MBL7551117.1 hypothetical protein [Frankia sp. AgB1.9]MBL7621884.1 hypothetical protein [Frankia sp. AgB1.8]
MDPIRTAIEYGIRAPNPHDTQAWRCQVISPTEMLFSVDPSRLLPVTDPPARQIHIGCGCFIEILSAGMTQHGYRTEVEYLPQGPYPLEEIGRKPVARIVLRSDRNMQPDPLADQIPTRQTNRRTYTGAMLTEQEIVQVRGQLPDGPAELMAFHQPDTVQPLLDIFYRAMEIEATTPRTSEETRIWFRYSEGQRQTKRDGLSAPQLGIDGLQRVLLERYLRDGDPKRWFSDRSVKGLMKSVHKGVHSARGVLLLKTATNEQIDWLKTGRAYARVQLTLTQLGLVCQPLSQVLQEFPEMKDLQKRFNELVGVDEPAKVQMAVRVGRADRSYVAPRRDPDSLLERDNEEKW